mmetsp:Transcript_6936/g.17715  ORF Transcript_6936/g.17715 Transcript_6936/m.17715 type:complete len:94 (-) Transcript_6936:4682-4963(-)
MWLCNLDFFFCNHVAVFNSVRASPILDKANKTGDLNTCVIQPLTIRSINISISDGKIDECSGHGFPHSLRRMNEQMKKGFYCVCMHNRRTIDI